MTGSARPFAKRLPKKSTRVRLRHQRAEWSVPQHKRRPITSNFKTSISILALAAGLTVGFAPGTSFAQGAGAATAGQNIADYVNKQTSDINAINPSPAPLLPQRLRRRPSPHPAPRPALPVS